MFTDNAEAVYCTSRIKRSTALALASTEICARLAHEGIATVYRGRLAALARPEMPIVRASPVFG